MSLTLVAALAAGYLLGGVPTAALVARLRGRDIFRVGSGNMGAMNTARNLGPAAGVAVLLIDVAKGAAAVGLGGWMATASGAVGEPAIALAAGVGAVIGHAWSPYVHFRGGKALATIFGTALAVAPLAAAYTALLLIALTLLLRRATPASVLTLVAYPLVTGTVLLRSGWPREAAFAAVTAAGIAALVSLAKHLLAARAGGRGGDAGGDA